ncbi:serine/threonine-protein kinase, partial [Curvibacter fontanus]
EAEDLKQGAWTDLYSLAAVVYSCLRNDPPLPATTRVVRDSMPSMQSVAKTVSEHFGQTYSDAFVQAVSHALVVQPTERPQSVHEFLQEMGLQAPAGLGRFDWRSALGADLLPVREAPSGSHDPTLARTEAQARVQPAVVAPHPPVPRRRGWVWRLAGAVVLLTGLGLAWGPFFDDAPLVAAPEPAPIVATPAPAPAQAVEPSQEATRPAAQAASPASAPRAAARPARPALKPLCADSGVFGRPICLFRECLKAENYNRPVCVESRNPANQPAATP